MISGTLSAAETNYNVLFIQSYTNSSSWHNNLIAGLQDGLEEGGVKANVVIEYLNADFWTFASECVIMRRICERARQRKTDLIVTSSDEAFFGSPDKPGGLSIQLCKSEKKEFYIRYSS